ncbi:MAG: hypothetical protein NTY34_00020 [Candidatus Omnitrophica bacterium]|nr:hypothetical protein [Candidatus Omnitrophota bacterium]
MTPQNMPICFIKKTFPEIGEIEYKIVSSRDELEQSMALVYREYLMRGFILPKYYKSGLRITTHHITPGTAAFIALKDKKVVATIILMPDSPLGLPLDMGYKNEADKLRKDRRKICEVGYLSIDSGLFGRGLFSMFNFKKLDFMFTLFKMVFQYAIFHEKFDNMCIVTNPKYMIFKFLPFKAISDVKYYGYDRIVVKKKAAVFKSMDLDHMRKNLEDPHKIAGLRLSVYKIFLGSRIPQDAFKEKYLFSPEDLRYFFVEKSDILKGLKGVEKEHIMAHYKLTEEAFKNILKGRSANE